MKEYNTSLNSYIDEVVQHQLSYIHSIDKSINLNNSTMKKLTLSFLIIVALMILPNFVISQTTYYSKSAATDFTSTASWGTNTDGSGTAPGSISNADNFIIQNSSAMTLPGNASVRQLTINTGSLTISANTLTVSRSTGNNSTLLIAGGTLNVTGGTITLNGNFSMTSGAFNQSGGNINIDGNDNNTSASSVASLTHLFYIIGGTPNCTAGNITIVDPPVNTYTTATTRAISIGLAAGNNYFSGTHTFILGDGVSTTAGNNDGFTVETYSSFRAPIQNLTVNAGNTTGRWGSTSYGSSAYGTHIKGTLTINSGSEFTVSRVSTSANEFMVGSVVNNGTFTTSRTTTPPILNIGGHASVSGYTPSSASSISGSGVFRNLSASPTAFFGSIVINNALGVSFASGVLALGTYTGHVSGTMTMTTGSINTNSQSLILGVGTGSTGT